MPLEVRVPGEETILQKSEYKRQLYAEENPFPRTEGSWGWIMDFYAESGSDMN